MGDYFKERRRIKRQIVRMNTPWTDRIRDRLFLWFLTIAAIVILVLVIRGRINGAW